MECSVGEGLAVLLTAKAFGQLFACAYATTLEVSVLGIVERDGNVFKVREFFLVRQDCSSAHTELDREAVGELVERLMKDGRADDAKKIRCWAHSHPGMDVFWSRTDDDTCRLLAADWFVSLVVSDNFKVRCRLDVTAPIPFVLDHVPLFCELPIEPALVEQCRKEVAEKVKARPLFWPEPTKHPVKEDKTMPKDGEGAVEIMEYCDECGGWHAEAECPLRFETGYELARGEREAAQELRFPDDEPWF